jgi:hypothetical protein
MVVSVLKTKADLQGLNDFFGGRDPQQRTDQSSYATLAFSCSVDNG